ncbi:carboxypeptidase-like regulatory domain-containing protein, partial [uncultured Bacteroides sp.]|uniref:carboxypeptidase-like regulatory domain-containing protein n=1 Tax=uncultured Bacteroides sp. TaxID=162156 RepID=UPI0025986EB1
MFLAGVLMLLSLTAYAQERTVTGKVYDAAGEPIIGASVVIQGTTQGTITDIDGAFQLKVQPSQTLVVSFLGYKDVILPVGNKNDFKITLEEDSKKLDEVVVVGYATQKKVNLTGSVASVSAKDIQDIPVANTATLLQGRLPGLVLTQNGAQAGNDNPEIRRFFVKFRAFLCAKSINFS